MTEANLEALATKLESAIDNVKSQGTDLLAKTEACEQVSLKTKTDLDEALMKMNETSAEIEQIKQAIAGAKSQQEEAAPKTLGERFIKGAAEQLDGMRAKNAKSATLNVKATIINSAGGLGGLQDIGFKDSPRPALTVRDLFMKARMDSETLQYTRMIQGANAADYAPENTLKPEAAMTFETVTSNPHVIAHWIDVTRQALSDNGFLQSQIDQILMYQLKQKEEAELLKGVGGANAIEGIVTAATAFSKTKYLAMTKGQPFDVLRLAMAQAVINNYPIDGFVLNPNDLADIQLTKDDVGRYIMGDPAGNAGISSLWGVSTAESRSMTEGTWVGGNFAMGATLFDRWDATVTAGYKNDDFTKNKITLLAEERIALAVYSDVAFMTGDVAPVA